MPHSKYTSSPSLMSSMSRLCPGAKARRGVSGGGEKNKKQEEIRRITNKKSHIATDLLVFVRLFVSKLPTYHWRGGAEKRVVEERQMKVQFLRNLLNQVTTVLASSHSHSCHFPTNRNTY